MTISVYLAIFKSQCRPTFGPCFQNQQNESRRMSRVGPSSPGRNMGSDAERDRKIEALKDRLSR